MKKKKKIESNPAKVSADNHPPWFTQLLKMDEDTRIKSYQKSLQRIKEAKPDAYEFITKFRLEFVGFMPNLAYSMPNDSEDSLKVTFVHEFSQNTLLFWCNQGQFAVFINPSLKYNDGNLRGFTY
jgi:hypothetical protein